MHPRLSLALSWGLFAATIVVNALANILPINGYNTGQGIWSLIYGWLLALLVYASVQRQPAATAALQQGWSLFWLSCVLNASWILAWHYLQVALSLLMMLALLTTLVALALRWLPAARGAFRWAAFIPVVIYLGWICVATIANTTALLVHYGWQGGALGAAGWSMCMMAIATALASWLSWRLRVAAPVLVLAWALGGIYRGQQAAYPTVATTALAAAAACMLVGAFIAWRRPLPAA
ncbi:MAG: tryptophan-rich sensory protein [Chitinophagaceae bacterium]|nr:tryptophan-rich sensory protein [Chitinophagaceae bacterium]